MLKKIDHHMLYMSDYRRRDVGKTSIDFGKIQPNKSLQASPNLFEQDYNHNYNNSLKPLQDNTTRVSFKGFKVESIPTNLSQHMKKMLGLMSESQQEKYSSAITTFIEQAKTVPEFRKYIGLADTDASSLSTENLIKLPQKPLLQKFFSVLVSPITMFKDLALWAADSKLGEKYLPGLYKRIQQTKKFDSIIGNYKNVIGLSNFIRIQENLYRAEAGHSPVQAGSKYLIPDDILTQKINKLRFKSVDPTKGQYSAKHLALGNRFVSGAVYAAFLSNDAYNTTMRYSNSENASQEQRRSRANQEFAKIGMNIYVQNLLFSTFENHINKSMANNLLASAATVAASEVIGRALVGRPIIPSNKETLDKMETEMQNKKGFWASIGRLIAGDKRTVINEQELQEEEPQKLVIVENNFFSNSISNKKEQSDFFNKSATTRKTSTDFFKKPATPSFKGFEHIPYKFSRERLRDILAFIKKLDETQAQSFMKIIEKSLSNIESLDNQSIKGKSLEAILNDSNIKSIPVGTTTTFIRSFTAGLLAPVSLVKKLGKSIISGITNLTKDKTVSLRELKSSEFKKYLAEQLKKDKWKNSKLSESEKTAQIQKEFDAKMKNFDDYLSERLKLDAWSKSPLSIDEKEMKIYQEFLSKIKDNQFEAQGVKNLILTLEKRFKAMNIDPKSNEAKNLQKAKEILTQLMTKADGANHAEYDANVVSQLNINLARTISTIFLVTDAYNLTIQYSNNDKREASKSAKARAVQEISRMASSAYILAFTHSIMSKIYNGSLLGAFGTVLLTSTTSDALARFVVGVPIFRKSHDELLEIERKQNAEKGPVRKALAYLLGKKQSNNTQQA